MVRIAKRTKKSLSPYPKVNALILAIQEAPDDELPGILQAVEHWHWPRTDLHYWIKPLNRFDALLEDVCKLYNIGAGSSIGSNSSNGDEAGKAATGDNVQASKFTPRTKELILAILRFTRLLLENATNRKLYASFDRMNDLLLTQDLDVLEAVLRLIFRRAQQIAANGQIHQAETFNLTPDRVRDLTSGWEAVQGTRASSPSTSSKTSISMYDIVKLDNAVPLDASLQTVSYQFYRKASAAGPLTASDYPVGEGIAMTPVATPVQNRTALPTATATSARTARGASGPAGTPSFGGPPATPAKQQNITSDGSSDAEGMTTIRLGNVAESGKSATDVLADAIELYRVPSEEKIRLLQRIRVAMDILNPGKRRQLLRIRLLAISVLIHTTSDQVAESSIFLYEPTFIPQVADLIHPSNAVPMGVRTVALLCLDTVSRVRTKVGEVTSSLSVSVNHGTLMSVLRRLVSDLQSDAPETTTEYIDALFNFLMHLQTSGFAGNMLLGAGVIPVLIDLTKDSSRSNNDSLLAANRAVSFLDNFTYSFSSASAPFSAAGGLTVFVDRVSQLVKRGVAIGAEKSGAGAAASANASDDMQIEGHAQPVSQDVETLSFPETTLLKSLFRCLQRLMGSGTNAEGIRNLIDSSLVESCRHVMQHRKVFGPQNLALSINIMLTFVHNEPTSLTVLQENKLPDAFYDAVEEEIEPSLDVLNAIPTAIGALCLNEAGLNQFLTSRLGLIQRFFDTFQLEKHARILNERENAVVTGANFDELVRHHPDLRKPVFEAITSLLNSLYEKGKDYNPESTDGYRLVQVAEAAKPSISDASTTEAGQATPATTGDVSMQEAQGSNGQSAAAATGGETQEDTADLKKEDNPMLTSVAITGRFLEGFFGTPSHCKDYISKDGLDPLLRLFTLPCIPFDLTHHSPYPGLTTVFLSMTEHAPQPLLQALLAHTKLALSDIREFWKVEESGKDAPPLDTARIQEKMQLMLAPETPEALAEANKLFRAIVRAQLIITILSEMNAADNYTPRQSSTQLLNTLRAGEELKGIHDLIALHRACTFANVRLKASLPDSARSTLAASATTNAPPVTDAAVSSAMTETTSDNALATATAPSAASASSAVPVPLGTSEWPESKLKNAKALKTVLTTIPDALKLFLQGVMTVTVSRRSHIDASQRRDATHVGAAIAVGVAPNLHWPDCPDQSSNFDYAALMVKFLADLIQPEGRSSSAGLHLIFLKALDKQEGYDRLIDLYQRYIDEASRLSQIPETEREPVAQMGLIHAIGGLKVVLGVFQTLTSHKSLLTPGHLLMLNPEKTSPSHFDANNFLVKLRARILPAIAQIWQSNLLATSPPIIVRAVFKVILQILEGQGEASAGEAAAGSIANPLPGAVQPRQPIVAAPALIQTLIDMGFPRAACENALVRRNNNLAAAADWLMTHPEVVAAVRTREAAEEARNNAQQAEAAAAAAPATGDEQTAGSTAATDSTEGTAATEAAAASAEGATSAASVSTSAAEAGAPVTASGATPVDVDMRDLASGSSTPLPGAAADEVRIVSPAPGETSSQGKATFKKYSREDLDAQRDAIKGKFINRALELAKDHGELVFDIRDALKTIDFKAAFGTYDSTRGLESILGDVVQLLKTALPSTSDEERSMGARVRLLALIFSDSTFRRPADALYETAMTVVDTLVNEYLRQKFSAENRPKWLASVMLLAELILARSEIPKESDMSTIYMPGDQPRESILRGPPFVQQRDACFALCLDVLRKGAKEKDIFQSSMRLTLFLTRRHEYASRFVEEGGLPLLMAVFDAGKKEAATFQQYAIMILRHVVENKTIVKGLLEKHVEAWLTKPKRTQDSGTFVRDLGPDANRDTTAFIQVTEELCRLEAGDTIARKKPSAPEGDDAMKAEPSASKESGMQIDELSKSLPSLVAPTSEIETLMHFLLHEAVTASTSVIQATQEASASGTEASTSATSTSQTSLLPTSSAMSEAPTSETAAAVPAGDKTDEPAPKTLQDYMYSTFILTAIGELVASYTPCKLGLLSYTKRKSDVASTAGPQSVSRPGKHKPFFLQYLLNELLPTGALTPGRSVESRKRFALSTQAIGVVINMCTDPIRTAADKEESSPDVSTVRKSVLDAIAKAFREAASTSTEAMNARYGRIAALSHLCSRLLAPPIPTGATPASRQTSELSLHMAKLMLEKNFAVVLTNALADVDLDYPQVQNLIDAILSPLEHLTKLVTKIGRPVDKPAGSSATADAGVFSALPAALPVEIVDDVPEDDASSMEDEMMNEGDEEHEEEQIDEEGADVYRNSALGMFEGELEPANHDEQYMSDEEMEDGMEGEWDEEEDDMMDEEGVVPSDVSDDSEAEEEEMAMANEMRDALDGEDDDMESSSEDDDDQDEDEDDGDDHHGHGHVHMLDDDEGIEVFDDDDEGQDVGDIQAELSAALQNGQLEPVDDFTAQLINEQMDQMGQPDNGGMIQVAAGGAGWDGPPGGPVGDDDEDDMEGDGQGADDAYDEDDDDDEDELGDEEGGGPPGHFDVNEMFQDLMGGAPPPPGSNVQLALMGGPPGAEQPIFSVDLGANAALNPTSRRTGAGTSGRAAAGALGQHSLLVDQSDAGRQRGRGDFAGSSRSSRRSGRQGAEYNEFVSSIEGLFGAGSSQLLEQVFGNIQGGGALAGGGPIGGAAPMGAVPTGAAGQAFLQNLFGGRHGAHASSSRHRNAAQAGRTDGQAAAANEAHLVNEAITNPVWVPATTQERWTEEAVLFTGGMQPTEKTQLIARRVTTTLLPEKRKRQKEQEEKDAKEKAERLKELEEQNAKAVEEEKKWRAEQEAAKAMESSTAGTEESAEAPAPVASATEAQAEAMETEEASTATPAQGVTETAAPAAVAPQTPAPAAATAAGSSDRPNWRERVARRRQEQAAAQATQQVQPSPSTSASAQLPGTVSSAVPSDLSEVLNLASRLATVDAARASGTSTPSAPSAPAVSDPMQVEQDAVPAQAASAQPVETQDQAMEDVQTTAEMAQPEVEEAEVPLAGPSTAAGPSGRIMIEIRGNMVDITDTGIDPTFLEALPDDMREEVLNQHFRETRAARAPPTQQVPTTISSEFLDALPPEMRAEVLAQEALERARIHAQEQAAAQPAQGSQAAASAASGPVDGEGGQAPAPPPEDADADAGAGAPAQPAAEAGNGGMVEMDPVAFLATLPPDLRETVLLEQGEDMLALLPPEIVAEYEALQRREMQAQSGLRRVVRRAGMGDGLGRMLPGSSSAARRLAAAGAIPAVTTVKREAVQLLDRSGVATLVRLLFFPPPLKKNALQHILINLCENTKTRIDLINLLLTILHDGTKEGGAGGAIVDRTFSQMSLTKPGGPGSAKPVSKGKGSTIPPSTPGVQMQGQTPGTPSIPGLPPSLVSAGPGENIPNLVVQRSLEALAYLVAANESSAVFFLTEQDLLLSVGGTGSSSTATGKKAPGTGKRDKGKGRASEAAAAAAGTASSRTYPIVVLLSLLDRESLTKSASIMEALTRLLAHITIPLRNLEANKKKVEEEAAAKAEDKRKKEAEEAEAAKQKAEAEPSGDATVAATGARASADVPKSAEKKADDSAAASSATSKLLTKAPTIPTNYLRMIVNILDLGECSAKMFSAALGLINNIWLLPEARKIISTELIALAQRYGQNLIGDLEELEGALTPAAGGNGAVDSSKQSASLGKFSQASSNQAKILRVLKTIEHAKQQQAKLAKKKKEEEERLKAEKAVKEKAKTKEAEREVAAGPSGQTEAEGTAQGAAPAEEIAAQTEAAEPEEPLNNVDELYDGFDFSPLWTKLSDCLHVIEKQEDVSNAGTLLPLIEAFLLVSSWGLEGFEGFSAETPSMLPATATRQSLSPGVQPVII